MSAPHSQWKGSRSPVLLEILQYLWAALGQLFLPIVYSFLTPNAISGRKGVRETLTSINRNKVLQFRLWMHTEKSMTPWADFASYTKSMQSSKALCYMNKPLTKDSWYPIAFQYLSSHWLSSWDYCTIDISVDISDPFLKNMVLWRNLLSCIDQSQRESMRLGFHLMGCASVKTGNNFRCMLELPHSSCKMHEEAFILKCFYEMH